MHIKSNVSKKIRTTYILELKEYLFICDIFRIVYNFFLFILFYCL
jgi:hypothetical protein